MMWILQRYLPVLCLLSLGATKLSRHGWLDRLVAYHKKNFIEELSRLPSPLTVTVEKAPPGFVDSPDWDKESVLRLVMLVEVLDAKPARHAIRRALSPSRRIYLPPGKNSFDLFPSWSKDHPNDFEYDDMVNYDDQTYAPLHLEPMLTENTVIYISNPVEAHLPSSHITVKLLREIMEARAVGLRQMPTTPPSTRSWKSKTSSSNATDAKTSEAAGNSTATTAAGGSTAANASTAGESSTAAASSAKDVVSSSAPSNGSSSDQTKSTESTASTKPTASTTTTTTPASA